MLENKENTAMFREWLIESLSIVVSSDEEALDITNTLVENFYLFESFLNKRKMLIEDVAKRLWMTHDDIDDVSTWIKSESIIENDLKRSIDPMNKKNCEFGINVNCLTYDTKNKTFPKILFKRI